MGWWWFRVVGYLWGGGGGNGGSQGCRAAVGCRVVAGCGVVDRKMGVTLLGQLGSGVPGMGGRSELDRHRIRSALRAVLEGGTGVRVL